MPEFRFLGLGEDVIGESLQEVNNDTWLIYPTERSCREAQQRFQQAWMPLNVFFLSMDEFKQKMIFSDRICLQDEKRLVCLYQAMSAEDKVLFHIEKYPDLIDWGQHFLDLFEELAEEEINPDELLQRVEGMEVFCQEWQIRNYTSLLTILHYYGEFITGKGFTDIIFDKSPENLHLPEGIKHFVFVNQFYYSNLERSIISFLEEHRAAVTIFYQGPEDWLDKTTLRSGEFNLEEGFPDKHLPFSLKVCETTNLWQMALAFLQDFNESKEEKQGMHLVIDAQFLQQPYHKVFSKNHFKYSAPDKIHNTRLFHFLQALGKGLENMLKIDNQLMVRLDWLLQAIGLEGFLSYFRPDWQAVQKDDFIGFICRFSDEDVLYLDMNLEILKLDEYRKVSEANAKLLSDIMKLLKRLNRINSALALAEAIDVQDGIMTDRLLSEEEKTCTNLRDSFYTGLANFTSIDELDLVQDWQLLYPGMTISSCIYALFLNFIKPRSYRINHREELLPYATLTNVMDTRNLRADKLTFLNLTEGVLPSSRTPVWLFNEKQRRAIGLKTWEDIRNWERHYFYRIIAAASEVEFYTIANQDRDTEPSSFLNELHDCYIKRQQPDQPVWRKVAITADALLKNLLIPESDNALTEAVSISELAKPDNQAGFFNIPFNSESDLGSNRSVSLSWSSCEHFLYNPALFFLRDVKRMRERTVRVEETLNRRMFGNLLHLYLMTISQRLAGQHKGRLSMRWEWLTNDFLQDNLKHALMNEKLTYQLPVNYNREFLAELVAPFLTDTAGKFFRVELNERLDSRREFINIIPEREQSTIAEQLYKQLIRSGESGTGYSFYIKGRADLRLETEDERYIIDFKTGSYHELQLVFYMWFYYLIEHPELEGSIQTFVYKLLDRKLIPVNTRTRFNPQRLKDDLLEALEKLIKTGYQPPSKVNSYDRSLAISRADLVKNLAVPDEEE